MSRKECFHRAAACMKVLPVVGRELRAISRRPSAYWMRSGAALGSFVAIGYVALVGAVGLSTANQGRDLFAILSWGAFAFCLLAGIRGTSDALSQEKREGTLGLLFLTDLKGYDVVLGKLASVSINSLYGILAVAPPLALAFIMGGTNATQFLLMIAFLLNTLFFSLAVGIFVSTFSQQDRPAMGGTLGIIFVILVMPYGIAAAHSFGVLDIWEVMEPGFLLASPAFAFWSIKDWTLLRIYFHEVLLSIAFIHMVGWFCLVVASASIAQRAHADPPRGKLMTWFARLRQEWAYGKAARRRGIRRALLDRNAFAWLAGRDRLKQRYAWLFLLMLGALWSFGRWKAPEITEEWPMVLFSLWFLHLFFKVWIASEVAARFIEDRRTNALELLLTTPLKLRQFVSGQRLALLRQFGAPIAAIVFFNLLAGSRAVDSSALFIHSPRPMHFFVAGLVHLAADLYAIHWVAIWRSMHLRGTNRTISQTIALIVFLPVAGWFFIWQGSWLAWALARRGGPSAEGILWTWTILCVAYDIALALIAQSAFFRDFREVATKAYDKPTPFRWKFRRTRKSVQAPTSKVTATEAIKPRWKRKQKIAIAFSLLLISAYVGISIRKHRLESAITSRLAAIGASGLPLSADDVPRWRPGPAREESASVVLRKASKMFVAANRPIQLIDAQAHWNSTEKLAPELKQKISDWIAENAEIFQWFEELPSRKPGGVPYDERYPFGINADDLARTLMMKGRVEMEENPQAAAKTITVLLHFVRALQGEAFGAFAGSRNALQCAKKLMERAALQGGFLAENWREWKSILAQLDPIGMCRTNLIIERAQGLAVFSLPVDQLYIRFGRPLGDLAPLFSFGWSIRRFFGQDKVETLEFLDHMAEYIAQSDQPFWQAPQNPRRTIWRQPTIAGATIISPQITPAFDWLFTLTTEVVAYQRILITVCDVEVFRAEHGELPRLAEIPPLERIDPFSGNKLRYVIRADGYSVYSVGEDRNDDGGVFQAMHNQGDLPFNCGNPPERKRAIKKP
jgi:ABC-type transport system involved in cytochrome c biogenesis permease component